MENEWKKVWNTKNADLEHVSKNKRDILCELKRANGYDLLGDGLAFETYYEEYSVIKNNLINSKLNGGGVKSVYEVGCGSGANLYLFENEGIVCGGSDYSEGLIKSAKKVLRTNDIKCLEASEIEIEPIYDAVFSKGVFLYFPDEYYALEVLEKMYKKANYSLGCVTILDKDKELDFFKHRKELQPDYEEKYKNLSKLFYDRKFFIDFAEKHNMEIIFTNDEVQGYWNNGFVYSCFMYKR